MFHKLEQCPENRDEISDKNRLLFAHFEKQASNYGDSRWNVLISMIEKSLREQFYHFGKHQCCNLGVKFEAKHKYPKNSARRGHCCTLGGRALDAIGLFNIDR